MADKKTKAETIVADAEKVVETDAKKVESTVDTEVKSEEKVPVAKVMKMLSFAELQKELDEGKHASLEDFVKAHYMVDANVQLIAEVLRTDVREVMDVLKETGHKFSEGV